MLSWYSARGSEEVLKWLGRNEEVIDMTRDRKYGLNVMDFIDFV